MSSSRTLTTSEDKEVSFVCPINVLLVQQEPVPFFLTQQNESDAIFADSAKYAHRVDLHSVQLTVLLILSPSICTDMYGAWVLCIFV